MEAIPKEKRNELQDPLGHQDDPPPTGAILNHLPPNVRQRRPKLRPKALGHLPIRPSQGHDDPIVFKHVEAEQIRLCLMLLE